MCGIINNNKNNVLLLENKFNDKIIKVIEFIETISPHHQGPTSIDSEPPGHPPTHRRRHCRRQWPATAYAASATGRTARRERVTGAEAADGRRGGRTRAELARKHERVVGLEPATFERMS